MTYDIVFIHRDLGQPFESAIEAALRGDPLPDRLRSSWLERLQPVMRTTFGTADVDEQSDEPEIRDPDSRLRLVVRGGGVVIEVPDDENGDELELMARTYALAKEVERVTGLEGYDTQLQEPISLFPASGPPPRQRASADDGPARPPRQPGAPVTPGSLDPHDLPRPGPLPQAVGGSLWRDGDERAGSERAGRDAAEEGPESAEPRRRWWKFWRG